MLIGYLTFRPVLIINMWLGKFLNSLNLKFIICKMKLSIRWFQARPLENLDFIRIIASQCLDSFRKCIYIEIKTSDRGWKSFSLFATYLLLGLQIQLIEDS